MESLKKYLNDENVVKDELYMAFQSSITCSICLDIIIEPTMCMKCQKAYCKGCIKNWAKINDKCPNRCQNPNYQKCLSMNELLSKLNFNCNICKNIINYNEVEKHYLSKCQLGKAINNLEKIEKPLKERNYIFHKVEATETIDEPEIRINIITLGLTGVGKTSLINNFVKGDLLKYQLATTGIEHNINKYMLSDGSIIYCSIIDTSGTERFRALNDNYYRQADGCILVYDITNERSFEEIRDYYIPKLKDHCKDNIKTILLGNKNDKDDERKILEDEGIELATKNKFYFKETTCTEKSNVFLAFQTIIEMTNFDMKRRERSETIKINKKSQRKKPKKSKRGCC